jgi:hypothetical protein
MHYELLVVPVYQRTSREWRLVRFDFSNVELPTCGLLGKQGRMDRNLPMPL